MILTGVILSVIFGCLWLMTRRRVRSGYIYLLMLLCMVVPSLLNMEQMMEYWRGDVPVNYTNIVVFGILLCLGFVPWVMVDSEFTLKRLSLSVNPRREKQLRIAMIVLVAASIYSIVYMSPYAFESIRRGAFETRLLIKKVDLLPHSFLTTIASGIAACNIFCILGFFVASLSEKLKSMRWWLLLGSLSFPVNEMVYVSRDAFVYYAIEFVVCYLIFNPSYTRRFRRRLGMVMVSAAAVTVLSLFAITWHRFHGDKDQFVDIPSGTLGYISQQPYVFSNTIEEQQEFRGFKRYFPLLDLVIHHEVKKPKYRRQRHEWMFGTMYANFYTVNGWKSMIGFSALFIGWFIACFAWLIRKKNYTGLLLLFIVYVHIFCSGLFYFRVGYSVVSNLFWLAASVVPLFVKGYVTGSTSSTHVSDSEKTPGNVTVVVPVLKFNEFSRRQICRIAQLDSLDNVEFLFVVAAGEVEKELRSVIMGMKCRHEVRVEECADSNLFRSRALNTSSDYVMFLDCDDWADFSRISEIVSTLNPADRQVHCFNIEQNDYRLNSDGSEYKLRGRKTIFKGWNDGTVIEKIEQCPTNCFAKIIPRELLTTDMFTSLPFAQDYPISYRLFITTPHIRHPETLYCYNKYSESMASPERDTIEKIEFVGRWARKFINDIRKINSRAAAVLDIRLNFMFNMRLQRFGYYYGKPTSTLKDVPDATMRFRVAYVYRCLGNALSAKMKKLQLKTFD